jgi:hypothetical protein
MKDLTKDQVRDYKKFFVERPESTFSPKRNKSVVDEVIKETELIRKRRSKTFEDKIRERSDAVATYLKAVERGKVANVDSYFGKKNLAYLRGQKIIETLKGKMKMLSDINN